jgi:hypothetical protein
MSSALNSTSNAPAASHQPRQPRHRATAAYQSCADLPLRQQRFLATGEAHIAGERELAADARRPPPNGRDGDDGRTAQPGEHVGKRLQPGGACGKFRRLLERRDEVVVGEKEAVHGAAEHHDLDVLVALQRGDHFVELRDGLRPKDIQRRVVERHSPVQR